MFVIEGSIAIMCETKCSPNACYLTLRCESKLISSIMVRPLFPTFDICNSVNVVLCSCQLGQPISSNNNLHYRHNITYCIQLETYLTIKYVRVLEVKMIYLYIYSMQATVENLFHRSTTLMLQKYQHHKIQFHKSSSTTRQPSKEGGIFYID